MLELALTLLAQREEIGAHGGAVRDISLSGEGPTDGLLEKLSL